MKKYSGILSVYFLILLTALVGCNDDDDLILQNQLVALAGEDKSAKVTENVSLDGSASYSKDNQPFAYTWTVTTKPQGSTAVIESSTSPKPSFKPDKPGLYIIQLRITRSEWFATDELTLTVAANAPEAPTTVILHGNISVDTTLVDIFEDPALPDYLVTDDIEIRGHLTIMPGVTVAFDEDKGLQIVNGSLSAKGNAGKGITFKGKSDQSGYWKGILIHTNSELNEFEYVTIKHGGSGTFTTSNTQANVTLAGSSNSGAALKARHSTFSESGGYGLYIQGMSSLPSFADNLFFNNASAAAYIPAANLHQIDSESFSENNGQAVETGGVVSHENEIVWRSLNYLVTSDITIMAGVTVQAGAFFKIKEGTTVNIIDNGYLHAAGNYASPITFTSTGPNIYWNGLYFNSQSPQNKIIYSEIVNAGHDKIADADHEANIVVGTNGILTIESSHLKNGLGYGLLTRSSNSINSNVVSINTFSNLQKGKIFPMPPSDMPLVTGTWLDLWSFKRGASNTVDNFYDRNSETWFEGANNPWAMNGASFGLRIEDDGKFIWTIAEHSPMTGCESFSAEFITGRAAISLQIISFQQEFWRSKFINKCDESQNVDVGVTPSDVVIPYSINKMYDLLTGEQYWELKLTNPDNSSFSLYRR